jgi:hypothetical protein
LAGVFRPGPSPVVEDIVIWEAEVIVVPEILVRATRLGVHNAYVLI